MIEHYDSSGRLEIRETMHSTDRSKVYLRTAFYADGSSIQTMYAPSGEAVLKTSIDANGHEEIVYSRAQERLRRRIEEAKDNKYFPKESIDWELLMSDKDGMQLADDLLFYIEDRKRQDEELPSLDKKQNENARKRSQAKLREAKKKALAKQEELQKRRGQAGNVAFSAAMSGKGRVSERFSLNGDVVSAIDAVAPVAIVGELPDDVLKAFNVWKKTKKDADRRVLAEAILDHVGRQEIVNADTGKRIPFTSEGFASVLKHASTDGAVYGKARFLVGLAAFLKDAVEIYHEPAEVPTFHTFVAPIVDDKTGKRVYGIATISGTTRLKVYDLNVYTPGGKESVGSGGQKNVAHMTGAKDLNSAVPNTKILLKTIFENQSSPTITVPELMSHVPGNTALSVGGFGLNANARAEMEKVRKQYEGTDKWMKAPNGKPTKLTKRLWLLVRTPAFKRWFGDWENDPANASKVVDENGEPLVVYHGSENAGFTTFDSDYWDEDTIGNFASSEEEIAGTYSGTSLLIRSDMGQGKRQGNYALFLNIRNPLIVDAQGNYWDEIPPENRDDYVGAGELTDEQLETLAERAGVDEELERDEDGELTWQGRNDLVEAVESAYAQDVYDSDGWPTGETESPIFNSETLEATSEHRIADSTRKIANRTLKDGTGYDGVIFRDIVDIGPHSRPFFRRESDVFVTKEGPQLKSAVRNTGNFDPNVQDIRLSVGERMGKWEADPEFNDVRPAEVGRQRRAGAYYPDIGKWIANTAFSIGERRKQEYRAVIAKKRPDLPAADVDAFMGEMEKLGNSKAEKAALHWFVKGGLQLPEDAEKLGSALKTAEKFKLDPFGFGSPDELLAEADRRNPKKQKLAYIDPDTVPELTNKRDLGHGVVVYDVEDSPRGQAAVRRIMNSHLGRDANGQYWSPWCLLTPTVSGGVSESAKGYWADYSTSGRGVAFYKGKICSFQSSKVGVTEWWDFDDATHLDNVPAVEERSAREVWGRDDVPEDAVVKNRFEINEQSGLVMYDTPERAAEVGNKQNGRHQVWSLGFGNKPFVSFDGHFVDGLLEGSATKRWQPATLNPALAVTDNVANIVSGADFITAHYEYKAGKQIGKAEARDSLGRLWEVHIPDDKSKGWNHAKIETKRGLNLTTIAGLSLFVYKNDDDPWVFDFLTGRERFSGEHISEVFPDVAKMFEFPPEGEFRTEYPAPGNVALSAAMLATGNINDRFESGADVFRTLDGIKRTTLPTIFPDPVRKALADWMRENNSTTKKTLVTKVLEAIPEERRFYVDSETGRKFPLSNSAVNSVLFGHTLSPKAVAGKTAFLLAIPTFSERAVQVYSEGRGDLRFLTYAAPVSHDPILAYGTATLSGAGNNLTLHDVNYFDPSEETGPARTTTVQRVNADRRGYSNGPNTKKILKLIYENQALSRDELDERIHELGGNVAMSVGERPGRAPTVEPGGDVREAGEGALAWLRRKFVHSQTPVFEAVRRVMGVGREPPDALNVEAAAKNVHGKIRARQEMLQRAYLEPLKAILAQPGLDRKRFDDYALALHALERNRMIQERSVVVDPTTGEVVDLGVEAGSGVTNAWAERVIREIQRDPFAEQYKEAANILAEMNRFVLRGAVADGLLTEAQARTWMRLSPHYVPLKSGGAAPGAIHKRATGRFTRPDSVLVNSMRQAYATVRNGELNRVNKTMADWIREYDPNGEQIGGTVPESHKHAKIKMADPQYVPKGSTAEALLRERGIRLVETEDKGGYWVDTGVLPQALKRVVRESVPQGDDIVTFWEDGERKFIRFEGKRGRDGTAENEAARIADALNFKNVLHKEGRFWDAIRGLTRWKANVSTSWNPTFIVRNMGADVFNTANLMMIEGKYAELARTMRNYPAALRTIARLHSLRREAGDSKMERMFADVSVQSSVGDCALIVRR